MQWKNSVTAVILLLVVFGCGGFAIAGTPAKAATFKVVQMDDPAMALETDAVALGLDLAKAEFNEDDFGFSSYATDDYEIRRQKNSSYFNYISKLTTWREYERAEEPVSIEKIEEAALTLLEQLGLPFDQIRSVDVNRISSQTEDGSGIALGPETTVGFLVYVLREIDGFRVYDSSAKVVFNAEGELHKITLEWREIDPDPIAYEYIVDETSLWDAGVAALFGDAPLAETDWADAEYGYEEAEYRAEQTTMELRYVFSYVKGVESFLMRESISAIN